TRSTIPRTWSPFATSARTASARRPSASSSATTSLAPAALTLKFTATSAPSRPKASAIARPKPRPAPVTSATRPSSRAMRVDDSIRADDGTARRPVERSTRAGAVPPGARGPLEGPRRGDLARASDARRVGAGRDRLPPARRGSRGLRRAHPDRARGGRRLLADRPGALGGGATLPGNRRAAGAGGLPRPPRHESRLARRDRSRAPLGCGRPSTRRRALRARSAGRLGRARSLAPGSAGGDARAPLGDALGPAADRLRRPHPLFDHVAAIG